MRRKKENTGFICENCHAQIKPLTNGSYRNHCPYCLHSKHVDEQPGDRLSPCRGIMKPIDIVYHSKKGYQIVHHCLACGKLGRNIIAVDTVQEDNIISFYQNII